MFAVSCDRHRRLTAYLVMIILRFTRRITLSVKAGPPSGCVDGYGMWSLGGIRPARGV